MSMLVLLALLGLVLLGGFVAAFLLLLSPKTRVAGVVLLLIMVMVIVAVGVMAFFVTLSGTGSAPFQYTVF